MSLLPTTIAELADAVRSSPRVIAVGAGTKPRLSSVPASVTRISLQRLSGIVEYEPDEFTFTALAGTPVREIEAALARSGQYLPFDPMLTERGATLGGTVAAGLSGPGRFRYGGLRDFIIGVRFVDGSGRVLRLGGKVVKNAAGFDLPKFFVGSAGRFGVLGEITFKVFPRRAAHVTARLRANGAGEIARLVMSLGNSRWEIDALEAVPGDNAVYVRLAGPQAAVDTMLQEILGRYPGELLALERASDFWRSVREFDWRDRNLPLVKISITPRQIADVCRIFDTHAGTRIHLGAGGNVAFVSVAREHTLTEVSRQLAGLGLTGMTLDGDGPLWIGAQPRSQVAAGVKRALDPESRFPGLDE